MAYDIENCVVLERISTLQKRLIMTGADLKIVEPQNIHITVRFLGNITTIMADKVFNEMKKVRFAPFNIEINGLGAFPNLRYSRVIWAGITAGSEQLKSVFVQLEPRLRDLGFTPDSKGFSPHLTIARVRSGRNKIQLANFITENGNFRFGNTRANCLRLKKSSLKPNGPIYSTLKEFCPQE